MNKARGQSDVPITGGALSELGSVSSEYTDDDEESEMVPSVTSQPRKKF